MNNIKKEDKGFVETHLDCPSCEHKKCFAINKDGSGYCFSCRTRIPNYKKGNNTTAEIKPVSIMVKILMMTLKLE